MDVVKDLVGICILSNRIVTTQEHRRAERQRKAALDLNKKEQEKQAAAEAAAQLLAKQAAAKKAAEQKLQDEAAQKVQLLQALQQLQNVWHGAFEVYNIVHAPLSNGHTSELVKEYMENFKPKW